MYFEQEQQYMSQPIDQISESSYIKINKKFLQNLKQINQIEDLSKYRRNSGFDSQIQSEQEEQQRELYHEQLDQMRNYYDQPGKQHSQRQIQFYQDGNSQQGNVKGNIASKLNKQNKFQRFFQTKKQNSHFNTSKDDMGKKSSKLSNSFKNQLQTPMDNTFQHYLLRKNQMLKQIKDKRNLQIDLQQHIGQNQVKNNQQHRRQNNLTADISRINYKKLLEGQIQKNKQLQRKIYRLQQNLGQLCLQFNESAKSSKKLQRQLLNAQRIKRQNKIKVQQLDRKLQQLKGLCRVKNHEKSKFTEEIRKQNKIIKDQNQKYKIFVQTLSESIFILKGKKPKSLEDVWYEWKEVFQGFSRNKWITGKVKSPRNKFSCTSPK